MMSLNIMFPLACMVITGMWYTEVYHVMPDEKNPLLELMFIASNDGTGFMQLVSCIYLVFGIMKIRNHFADNAVSQQIDSKVLWLHATAFGVYLFSVILWCMSLNLNALLDNDWTV